MLKNENNQTQGTIPVAVVTGANRGLGAEVSLQMAELGFRVIVAARSVEKAQPIVDQIVAAGGVATSFKLDVTQPSDAKALAAYVRDAFGRLDVLVNNAGIAVDQWVSGFDVDLDVVRATLDTNLIGVLNCCQQLMPIMREQHYGRVVNVSSELASLELMEMGSTLAYRVSKTALNSLTKLLALELKEEGNILINAACPGWVRTELGGEGAPRSVAEGADTIVWLTTLAEGSGSGGLYRDRALYPW